MKTEWGRGVKIQSPGCVPCEGTSVQRGHPFLMFILDAFGPAAGRGTGPVRRKDTSTDSFRDSLKLEQCPRHGCSASPGVLVEPR